MRKRVALVALAAALALPATAAGTIVIGKGIGGVALGMSQAQVRARLGPPARVERGRNDFGPYVVLHYPTLTVRFQAVRGASSVSTTSPRERTPSGVGVGSTRAELRAKVPGIRCQRELGVDHCWVGRFQPGRVVTDFLLRKDRVSRVTIGVVID